jgi:hypothetical protein
MKEAFGGDGYKSACNLFYINKHIANQIDENSQAIYISDQLK